VPLSAGTYPKCHGRPDGDGPRVAKSVRYESLPSPPPLRPRRHRQRWVQEAHNSQQLQISFHSTRIPGLVREHRADKANDDIRNSARTKGCVLKTRRIPRTLSALLLVEQSIQGFYWIFATLAHAQNKSWCSRTNPDTRVPTLVPVGDTKCRVPPGGF